VQVAGKKKGAKQKKLQTGQCSKTDPKADNHTSKESRETNVQGENLEKGADKMDHENNPTHETRTGREKGATKHKSTVKEKKKGNIPPSSSSS
jgi:hypothetical protein